MKKISLYEFLTALCLPLYSLPVWSMTIMNDGELSTVDGQSLVTLSYLAPADAGNFETLNNVGFYKLGVEATIEANLNIKKLQLGCGGANGPGACDIDIDNLSLSGNSATNTGRVQSDAKLENPFFQFAIKNPDSASTREVVGFRVSAERAIGLLTAGTENSTTPNGINTISGFMRIQSDSTGYVYGKANTIARVLNPIANANYVVDGVPVTLNNEMTATIDGGVAVLKIKTTGGAINIPAMSGIPFIRPGVTVNANRVSSLPLKATLSVPPIKMDWRNSDGSGIYPVNGTTFYHNPTETPINWAFNVPLEVGTQGGALTAQITDCLSGCTLASIAGVNVGDTLQNSFIKGTIQGITANATINQGLGYIHSLPINSPFSLSLQQMDMRWPGSYSGANPERTNVDGSTNFSAPTTITDVAKKGWWMSFADPINLGSVDPTQGIDIAPLFPQLATLLSNQLNTTPYPSIGLGSLFNAILGTGDIEVTVNNPVDLSASPLTLILNDLQLSGQSFAPNCYGTLKFC